VLHGKIDSSEVIKVQKDSDILVHAESFKFVDKLRVRLSFSTKIVDYLSRGKCILAVGCLGCASIDYLKNNDLALVVYRKSDIMNTLLSILEKPELLNKYADKSWNYAKRNLNINDIRKKLVIDIEGLFLMSV